MGVAKIGGAAKGVRKGPLTAPRRCNICSWFEKRKVIQARGHKYSKEEKKDVGQMNKSQLKSAVDKMLREAENET